MKFISKIIHGMGKDVASYSYKDLSADFIEMASRMAGQYGFTRDGRACTYYRKNDSGRDILHFPISKYEGYFEVLPSAAIRFDQLEIFIDKYAVNRDAIHSKNKASIGQTFGDLEGKGDIIKWKIKSYRDIERYEKLIEITIDNLALPYFNRFASLRDLFDSICLRDEDGHIYGRSERAIYCVAIAYLLDDETLCSEMIGKWHNSLEANKDPSIQFFEGFLHNFMQDYPSMLTAV